MRAIHKLSGNICNLCRTIITETYSEHLICPNCQEKAIKIVKIIRNDAKMALNDKWDRSDEGFKAQIDMIDNFLKPVEDD